jgi:hypothetical protein
MLPFYAPAAMGRLRAVVSVVGVFNSPSKSRSNSRDAPFAVLPGVKGNK